AVFLDQTTRDIVRLRTGESHVGWVLRSVKGREATLQKDRETILLALPAPNDIPGASGALGALGAPGPVGVPDMRGAPAVGTRAPSAPAAAGPGPAGAAAPPPPPPAASSGPITVPGGGTITPVPGAKPVPVTMPGMTVPGVAPPMPGHGR